MNAPHPRALELALACRELSQHRALLAAEPIAIVGIGCRFPGGANDPASFWRMIEAGIDAISATPPGRYGSEATSDPSLFPQYGGYIDNIADFDASFFRLTPREARAMDPQQRLLLEIAWETLEDARVPPESLYQAAVGTFVGMSSADYAAVHRRHRSLDQIDAYFGSGNAPSVAAGRLAYHFGWTGPTLTVDTSCSSSLSAVHLAVNALRQRECRLAIAGGVNILLAPETSVAFARAAMLSPSGRCRTFRADADGYVRGEGCGLVLLAPLADALADGLPIRAVIRGSAQNHDGPSGGLTVPNGPAQVKVIEAALAQARLRASDVQYVEAHGTGTPLGDPIEANALDTAYGGNGHEIIAGSVKTLIGHLESAAGIAGLIKTVLALQHRRLPPDACSGPLNPAIDWDRLAVRPSDRLRDWPDIPQGARTAGISAFGFSGTNVHLLVEEAPRALAAQQDMPSVVPPVLPISARTVASLQELAARYRQLVPTLDPMQRADLLRTAQTGRNHFGYRIALPAPSLAELEHALHGATMPAAAASAQPTAFLFTGQGSQYLGMGRALYQSDAAFRTAMDACEAVMAQENAPILQGLFATEADRLNRAAFAQPALTMIQIALIETWATYGVRPAIVLGHSLGEIAAAVAAGIMHRDDALRLALARGSAMDARALPGGMIAVAADEAMVAAMIASGELAAEIAVVNAPGQVVVAAALADLPAVEAALQAQGVPARRLEVTHAFHSACMDPVLDMIDPVLARIAFRDPAVPFVSSMTGQLTETVDARYWRSQIRQPVRFTDAVATLAGSRAGIALEIGPRPLLARLMRSHPAAHGMTCIEGLSQGRPDGDQMAAALGALYAAGVDIAWPDQARSGPPFAELPLYPFDRQRIWIDDSLLDQPAVARRDILYHRNWRPLEGGQRMAALPRPADVAPEALADVMANADLDALRAFSAASAATDAGLPMRIVAVLQSMGLTERLQQGMAMADIVHAIGVVPTKLPLLEWLLNQLVHSGMLRRDGDRFRALPRLKATRPLPPASETILVDRSLTALPGVLTGAIDPLEVIAPDGDLSMLDDLYGKGPLTGLMNALVARVVAIAARKGRCRILEVGAGTGSTSRAILDALGEDCEVEYVWTDVSPAFVARASSAFAHDPRVSCRVLDIETELESQGFRSPTFDVVVAANVVHATARIDSSIARLRDLLAKGGWLVLLEGVEPVSWVDLIFGLTDGWWRFRGDPRRSAHPLLDTQSWLESLASVGLVGGMVLRPQGEEEGDRSQQAVIMAQRAPDAEAQETPTRWTVAGDLTRARIGIGADPDNPCRCSSDAPTREDAIVSLHMVESTTAMADGCSIWPAIESFRQWVHECARDGHDGPIICISRGAVSASGAQRIDPVQAALTAFVQGMRLEYPQLDLRTLDIDPGDDDLPFAALDRMIAAGEQQAAWRDHNLFVPRLERCTSRSSAPQPVLRRDASYLVTGASGTLAAELIPWLARAGAGRLVLAARRPETIDPLTLAEARAAGAEVQTVAIDIADEAAVAALCADKGLRGVFHLAGVMATAQAETITAAEFEQIWNAKVRGAMLLDRLCRSPDIDHFVLFSSSTAIVPIAGQAGYAAANAAIDAIAAERRRSGLAGLTIGWGPWQRARFETPGLAAAYGLYARLGITPLAPVDALAILGDAMARNSGGVVLDIKWDRLFHAVPSARQITQLDGLARREARSARATPLADRAIGARLRALPLPARIDALGDLLRHALAAIVEGQPDTIALDDELIALGLDSLMAVELRTSLVDALDVRLPLSDLLAGGTVGSLAARLAQALQSDGPSGPQSQLVEGEI